MILTHATAWETLSHSHSSIKSICNAYQKYITWSAYFQQGCQENSMGERIVFLINSARTGQPHAMKEVRATSNYIQKLTQNGTLSCITFHPISLYSTTFHSIPQHSITFYCVPFHQCSPHSLPNPSGTVYCITLHPIPLHSVTFHNIQTRKYLQIICLIKV